MPFLLLQFLDDHVQFGEARGPELTVSLEIRELLLQNGTERKAGYGQEAPSEEGAQAARNVLARSCLGERPNLRVYSRLNWFGLS